MRKNTKVLPYTAKSASEISFVFPESADEVGPLAARRFRRAEPASVQTRAVQKASLASVACVDEPFLLALATSMLFRLFQKRRTAA